MNKDNKDKIVVVNNLANRFKGEKLPLDLPVTDVQKVLNILGMKLRIWRKPHSLHSTYYLTFDDRKVFEGNFENFLRFLRGFFILWEAIGLTKEVDLLGGVA